MQPLHLGVIMDPISKIKIHKDSTFAMMLAAQKRKSTLWYIEMADLFWLDGKARAKMRRVEVEDNAENWFVFGEERVQALSELDAILMRKDPPFDMEYIYATYFLDDAANKGCLVVNNPSALRNWNEKFSVNQFPELSAPTLVSRDQSQFRAFLATHQDIILKPLDGMGGASIFRVKADDANTGVILETLTQHGSRFAMAQRYIPEISAGDKRILLVNGEPVPYALARIPKPGENRGNLAAGGTGKGVALSSRDRFIADQLGPILRDHGIVFAGIDVIGDYLTEINITSPTCIRELDAEFDLDIAGDLLEVIATQCQKTQ